MKKKRNLLFIVIISLTISVLLGLSSILNIVSFRNTYINATASGNAIVASGTVNKIEYTLKYGKSLENYYGIEELFEELQSFYGYLDCVYITDIQGNVLYDLYLNEESIGLPQQLSEFMTLAGEADDTQIWLEDERQHILLPIHDRTGAAIAGLGISYRTDQLAQSIRGYVDEAALFTAVAIGVAITLLTMLFFIIKHGFQFGKLLLIVILVVVAANVFFGFTAYQVFSSGYLALTKHTSDIYWQKIQSDVEGVAKYGVAYGELADMDQYFNDMVSRTEVLERIEMIPLDADMNETQYTHLYTFAPDYTGETRALRVSVSSEYVDGKITGILIEIAISIITSLMIAAEVIIFILAALTSTEKVSRFKSKAVTRDKEKCCQPYGIVRGLAFFFSMFRYMAMAFVTLVIIDIYKPVILFGFELPYEIVISMPLTAQMLSSMLGSFISGKLSARFGWKLSACLGILFMAVGSLLCAFVKSPLVFVGFQLIFGLGLGISKTSVDLYSVVAASDNQMERYTSNANASTVVGLSCASAIGAIIAGALGYSGAYTVMAGMGVLVMLLFVLFGQNIISVEENEDSVTEGSKKKRSFDFRFILYIVFLVLPYYFVIMFVDYLFPVFANSQGLTTSMIGYVFLAYGVTTSYIGTFLCRVLSKRIRTVLFMSLLVFVLGVGLGVFSAVNNLVLAIALVLLIALCDGIMPSLQFKYVYTLPTAKRIGFSRALGIEGFFTGAISSIAPIVFSVVMMTGDAGFMVAAGVVVICSLVFRFGNMRSAPAQTPEMPEGGSDHA